MLEIRNLCAGYPGRPVLQDVSLTAPEGGITAILGPNGCGKSTLLKAVCGILSPSGGEISLDGKNLLALPQNQLARHTAYLAQGGRIPEITAGRLVLHGRFPYLSYPRHYRPQDHAAVRAAMEKMDVADLAETPLSRLSGGQRQKVYIAMALAQDTPVLLLDEPTTYLDVSRQLQLLRIARELAAEGKHILMVLHDLTHAFQAADKMALMQDGKIVFQGTPDEVYRSGAADSVFGIRLFRVETPAGPRYFCEEGAP